MISPPKSSNLAKFRRSTEHSFFQRFSFAQTPPFPPQPPFPRYPVRPPALSTAFIEKQFLGNLIEATKATLDWMQKIAENLVDVDPLFVEEVAGDLHLRLETPARAILGWKEIPFARIGISE